MSFDNRLAAWCPCWPFTRAVLFGLRVPPRPSTLARLFRLNLVYHVMYCQYSYPRYGQLAVQRRGERRACDGHALRGLRAPAAPGPHDAAARVRLLCAGARHGGAARQRLRRAHLRAGGRGPAASRQRRAPLLLERASAGRDGRRPRGHPYSTPEHRTGPRALSDHRAARPPARLPVSDVARGGPARAAGLAAALRGCATRRPRSLRARRAQRLPGHDRVSRRPHCATACSTV